MGERKERNETSGKFVLRVSPQMHSYLKQQAQSQDLSLNEYIKRKLDSGGSDMIAPSSIDNRYKQSHQPVVDSILNCWGDSVVSILCFGSSVRGEQNKSSDIDLLIVLNQSVPINRQLYRDWDDKIGLHVDARYTPQIVKLPESIESLSSLWLEVAIEGEFIFERETSVRSYLLKLRQKIASGDYLRKMTHGHPYWIRTSDAKP